MEINNSDFDKFEIANGETVIALRKEAKINKQSSIEGEFISEGFGSQKYNKKLKRKKMTSHVSLRTYQKIEKSEQVNIKYIKYVAMLFSKKLARHVDVKDLIKGAISSNPNIVNTYLNKVNSVDELLEIIKLSSTIYKKTFFNCKITEGVAKQINNIIDIIRTNINSPKDNIEVDDEKDFLIDREILKTASQVNDSLNALKGINICLYAGILKNVPILTAEEFVDVLNPKKDPYNPNPYYPAVFETKSFIEKRDYLILNFTNCSNGSSIDLSYHLDWNFDDLNKFIKKNPFYNKRTENVLEEDVEYGGLLSNLKRAIQNAKKYYKSIDSSLLLPWGLEKNNFKFNSSIDDEKIMFDNEEEYLKQAREDIEAELLSEGEDRAAELQLDMIRGK